MRLSVQAILSGIILAAALLCGCGQGTTSSSEAQHFTNIIPSPQEFPGNYCMEMEITHHLAGRVYQDKFWHLSDGQYRLDCEAMFDLVKGERIPVSEATLLVEQENMARRKARMLRGFRIINPQRFLDFYDYAIISTQALYLEREVMVVKIFSRFHDRPSYEAWLDKETGLCLKYVEFTRKIKPVTTMEVTLLDLSPDISGIKGLVAPLRSEGRILDRLDSAAIPFIVREPTYLPPGFVAEPPVVVEKMAHGPFVFQRFNDGIQTLEILQFPMLEGNKNSPVFDPTQFTFNEMPMPGLPSSFMFVSQGVQFQISGNLSESEIATIIQLLLNQRE